MFLIFPNFNIFSTPLLILASQGFIFGILLLLRFQKQRVLSDLFLAFLVLITCYHRTTYTIGFMDWYDTFRNTKINYWLITLSLAIGPFIYFYIKSVTTSDFKFSKKDLKHFVPVAIYVIYRIVIFVFDANQSGFNDTQNGELMSKLHMGAVGTFIEAFSIIQQLLYLAFALQLYYNYRNKIQNFFSNTYRLELNWIRNFLFIYSFLFLYSTIQQLIELTVFELSWIQRWWYQFFSALAVIYIGVKGYFTDTGTLNGLEFDLDQKILSKKLKVDDNQVLASLEKNQELEPDKNKLLAYMKEERPYLNPDLNLKDLASNLNITRAQLSDIINSGFHQNFNDFINGYRIETFKEMLKANKQEQLSLLGIAYECGFNSKATFNRVFKKLTSLSPTEYLKTIH